MTTIDHPLLEANRAIASGFLDPEALDRIRAEWHARPHTAAQMRESIFEILGPGYRGCIPLGFTEVLDPETFADVFPELPGYQMALGVVDDASVLALADGTWLGVAPVPDAERRMMGLFLEEAEARDLAAQLEAGRKPVWAIPATSPALLPMGTDGEFQAFMAGFDGDATAQS